MTRWDSDSTIERMSNIMNPKPMKKQDGPFGAVIEAVVPYSPRGDDKNASKKSKRGLQVRKRRQSLSKKSKRRSSV